MSTMFVYCIPDGTVVGRQVTKRAVSDQNVLATAGSLLFSGFARDGDVVHVTVDFGTASDVDVTDPQQAQEVFEQYAPDTVFEALQDAMSGDSS